MFYNDIYKNYVTFRRVFRQKIVFPIYSFKYNIKNTFLIKKIVIIYKSK